MTEINRYREPPKEALRETLWEELDRVNRELSRAEELFNAVTEDALIEACTYRIQTLLTYRAYLLRMAKQEMTSAQTAPAALQGI